MTFRRLHVIIVECGEINCHHIYRKGEFVNNKNVNNEIIARDYYTKSFARIESR